MLDTVMAIAGAVHAVSAPPAPCAPPPTPQRGTGAMAYVDPAFVDAKSHLLGVDPKGEAVSPLPTLFALVGPSGALHDWCAHYSLP